MAISKITRWLTDDGVEHSSPEMAEQYLANKELLEVIGSLEGCDAQDVLNTISGNRATFRKFLDLCDALEKASLR